jgi:hypothetical protein
MLLPLLPVLTTSAAANPQQHQQHMYYSICLIRRHTAYHNSVLSAKVAVTTEAV